MECGAIVPLGLALLFIVIVAKSAWIVPEKSAYVVERLGKYAGSIGAGFHILLPFVDAVRYKHSLKEQNIELRGHICTSRDNRQIRVDGFLRFKIVDPEKASYAVHDCLSALRQVTQAVLNREIHQLEAALAREDWAPIASAATTEVAREAEPWGIEVLRFELENLTESLPS